MPLVTMPDGATVDMPDQLDPQTAQRLRNYQNAQPHQEGLGTALLGDADAAMHGLSSAVVGGPVGAVAQLGAQALGKSPAEQQAVQDWVNQHLVYQPHTNAGNETVNEVDNLLSPIGRGVNAIDQAIPDAIRPYVEQAARTAGNLAGASPLAAAETALTRSGVEGMAARAAAPATPLAANDIEGALVSAGYRNLPRQSAVNGAPAPGLLTQAGTAIVGEPQLASSFRLSNQGVTDNLARNEAGVPIGQELNYDNLAAARASGPGQVYNAAHDAIPPQLAADGQLTGALQNITNTASQLPRSPDVEALQQHMLAQPTMSRDQLFANIQDARNRASQSYLQEGPNAQALGDAYTQLAGAYEDFAGRQLAAVPNAPVSLADFQNARVAMAKNYAVQNALQGTNINAAKIATLQRSNPQLLTGGLQLIAEQANRYPLTSGLGSRGFAPADNVSFGSNPLLRAGGEMLAPAAGAALGGALGGPIGGATGAALGLGGVLAAKKGITGAMTGDPAAAAAAAAGAAKNPALGNFFGAGSGSPWAADSVPFTPRPAGLLPAPTFSAGASSAPGTPTQLGDMGLTPDVQAAGQAHPGAPRISPQGPATPLGDLVASREPGSVPYAPGAPTLQPNWGLSASTPVGPGPRAPEPNGPTLADLLSTGVEQPAAPGLSMGGSGPLQAPAGNFAPSEAQRLSGDLSLAPEDSWFTGGAPNVSDMPAVASQGVPEGTVQRTSSKPTKTSNNASGESSASQEAISRSQQEQAAGQVRYRVNPDDSIEPLTGVDSADATAPPGGLVIQRGVGSDVNSYTILDRGGQPATLAQGQLNRALTTGLPPHPGMPDIGSWFGGQ